MNILTDYTTNYLNEHLEEIPKTTGVYAYINEVTGKMYIGQSINLKKRYIEHLNGTKSQIDKALKKEDQKFSYRILIMAVDASVLQSIEASYINQFHTVEYGYNVRQDKLKEIKIDQQELIMEQEYTRLNKLYSELQSKHTELILLYNNLVTKYNKQINH